MGYSTPVIVQKAGILSFGAMILRKIAGMHIESLMLIDR
jgi:hypothetical protein